MTFDRVAIVAHPGKRAAADLLREVTSVLEGRGIKVTDDEPDLVVSLGGDGTMLRAAQSAHAAEAPLFGINVGMLGYLTEVDAEQGPAALERIFNGDYHLEERMMLSCELTSDSSDEATTRSYVGLNEVLVERTSRHRLVHLAVYVGGEHLASFNADGVIVATPTGSTAYALSAGGPIVSPKTECLVVVPVSPHMIFSRPFVLDGNETVEIVVAGAGRDASLSLDGRLGCDLAPGAHALVRRHPRSLKLIRLAGPRFVERLRAKLGLP